MRGDITSVTLKYLCEKYNAPLFVSAVDMQPMTGGCYYFHDCNGYKEQCRCCPVMKESEIPYKNFKLKKEVYAKAAKDALQLLDLENIPSKTYTVYNKESLRTYLKNPLSDSNSKQLRKLSQYLYVLSAQYRRIISYFASQIDLTAYNVIPNISMVEDNDDEKILQNYEATLKWIEKMNMQGLIFSILVTAFREDCFYGYIYYDESSEQDMNSFVILPLDPDYCRISSINLDGTLNCAFDFTFFDNSSNAKYLEYWDKEFNSLYNTYKIGRAHV